MKNKHYYFELTEDKGKNAGYDALKLLFTPQTDTCDKTLIHCDSLITLAQTLAYADTIGQEAFNQKIKSGTLRMWLTYDGLSAVENDKSKTPVTEAYFRFEPASEMILSSKTSDFLEPSRLRRHLGEKPRPMEAGERSAGRQKHIGKGPI